MRSASSSTKWLTSFSFSSPVAIRSQIRPGVPTTISAPAAHPLHLHEAADAAEDGDDAAASARSPRRRRLSSICNASSRVGARMRARVA